LDRLDYTNINTNTNTNKNNKNKNRKGKNTQINNIIIFIITALVKKNTPPETADSIR
jgi:hypothetical protein